MKCNNCGNELNEGDVFCNKCGNKVTEEVTTPNKTLEKTNNTDVQNKKTSSIIFNKILVGLVYGLIFYFYLQIFDTPQAGRIVGFVYMFVMGLISIRYGIIILITCMALYFLLGPWILILCPFFALASAAEEMKNK